MLLANSTAEIIRQLLIDLELGVASLSGVWPVVATGEPDKPDNVITTYNVTGSDGGRIMIDGELLTHYGFQVRVRSREHSEGWIKADTIRHHLAQSVYQRAVAIDSNRYVLWSIEKITNINDLGKEASISKRNIFTINATVPIRVLS